LAALFQDRGRYGACRDPYLDKERRPLLLPVLGCAYYTYFNAASGGCKKAS
jgi:hypothetical protein